MDADVVAASEGRTVDPNNEKLMAEHIEALQRQSREQQLAMSSSSTNPTHINNNTTTNLNTASSTGIDQSINTTDTTILDDMLTSDNPHHHSQNTIIEIGSNTLDLPDDLADMDTSLVLPSMNIADNSVLGHTGTTDSSNMIMSLNQSSDSLHIPSHSVMNISQIHDHQLYSLPPSHHMSSQYQLSSSSSSAQHPQLSSLLLQGHFSPHPHPHSHLAIVSSDVIFPISMTGQTQPFQYATNLVTDMAASTKSLIRYCKPLCTYTYIYLIIC